MDFLDSSNTLLHCAVLDQRTDLLETLLSCGADINSKNSRGETPLSLAILAYNPQIFNTLIQYGGIDNSIGEVGLSPLGHLHELACGREELKDIVNLLLSGGYDIWNDKYFTIYLKMRLFESSYLDSFVESLKDWYLNPQRLSQLCRSTIRRSMRDLCSPSAIRTLPLPTSVKSYLLLQKESALVLRWLTLT